MLMIDDQASLPRGALHSLTPYQSHVVRQSERNPCLQALGKFLTDSHPSRRGGRMQSLSFTSDSQAPVTRNLNPTSLSSFLVSSWDQPALLGQILLVEDIDRDAIEVIGSHLDVDPLFFAGHVHAPFKSVGVPVPAIATLPSRTRPGTFTTIQYHRPLRLRQPPGRARHLLRYANVDRKIAILPSTRDAYIALARHCCSVLRARQKGKWLCVILVDPPLSGRLLQIQKGELLPSLVTLASEPFLGGFEDFLDPPSLNDRAWHERSLSRSGLFEDLTSYWEHQPPEGFDICDPDLLSLTYYPLRIAAAEWMLYIAVMHNAIKEYEYSVEDHPKLLQRMDKLNADLRSLQAWRRRCISSQRKIESTTRFIKMFKTSTGGRQEVAESLIEDYQYISANIEQYGRRLENMLPVVTSLVQIIDSRRSFVETANVSRLTYLALVFVPLGFTTSLFSMGSNFAPDGPRFWIFFVVAIPLTFLVFLAARPPSKLFYWLKRQITSTPSLHCDV